MADPTQTDCTPGDNNRSTYGFFVPLIAVLLLAKAVSEFVNVGDVA